MPRGPNGVCSHQRRANERASSERARVSCCIAAGPLSGSPFESMAFIWRSVSPALALGSHTQSFCKSARAARAPFTRALLPAFHFFQFETPSCSSPSPAAAHAKYLPNPRERVRAAVVGGDLMKKKVFDASQGGSAARVCKG